MLTYRLSGLFLITSVLENVATEVPLHAVEIVGGGCRIPWVQETIQQVLKTKYNDKEWTLAKSFDDTCS